MFKILSKILLNSFKGNHPKIPLGRWAPVSYKQSQNRAMRSSNDHCGDCTNLKFIDLDLFLDEKDSKEAIKELPDTGPYRCKTCGSMYHTTKECPNKINS